MAKKTSKQENSPDIEGLAEKLGIKKENLEYGLKHEKKRVEEGILKAAKWKGLI